MKRLPALLIPCLTLLAPASPVRADTFATTEGWANNYPWTNPTVWGYSSESGCFPDNVSAICGDGRWFVTLSTAPILNTDITLTGLSTAALTGGISGGAVTMTVTEVFNWVAPSARISLGGGTLHLLPAAVSTMSSGWNGTGCTILHQGAMQQTAPIRNGGTIINDAGAEWVIDLSASNYFIWDGAGSFINHGLLRKVGPASTYSHSLDVFEISATGELRVEEGEFSIHDSSTTTNLILDGEVEVFPGAVVVFSRPVNFGPTASVHGGGTVRIDNHPETLDVDGSWVVLGLTKLTGGDVNFITRCFTWDYEQCIGVVTGDVDINGQGLWSDGVMATPGMTTVYGDLTINTATGCGDPDPITLDGRTILVDTGSQLRVEGSGPTGVNGGTIQLLPGSLMTFDTPSDFRVMPAAAGGGFIENDSTVVKTGPGAMFLGWAVNNRSLFDLAQSTVHVQNNSFTQTSGELRLNNTKLILQQPAILDLQGGALTGGGIIEGTVHGYDMFFCAATIAPGTPGVSGTAGFFDLNCNVVLQAGAVLDLELGGTAPGTGHDWLDVWRNLTLDGDLRLSFINGFENAVSASDVFILADLGIGTLSGSFDNVASGGDLETTDGKGVFTIYYGAGSPFPADQVVATNFRPLCPADLDADGDVGVLDLLAMLGNWGPCPAACAGDFNGDGAVDVVDLLDLLGAWGPCP